MTKKLEFTAKNAKAFTGWLKRFASIENTLMLEIDETTEFFKAKSYNEERSCVKHSQIKFSDANFSTKVSKDPKRIKVGLFNIGRLIKVLDQFSTEFTFIVNYDELVGTTETEFAGLNIIVKNDELKMMVDCSSLSIFNYISDDKFIKVIASIDKDEEVQRFDFTKENIEKVNSLCNLDSDYKSLIFNIKDKKLHVTGKMFELLITSFSSDNEGRINMFKEQFSKLDVENYKAIMGTDRVVFHSEDSETITVISMVDDDE